MSRMTLTTCLLFLAGCVLAGCAASGPTPEDELAAYLGKPINEAIEEMGRPSGAYNMQNGTFEYEWEERVGGRSGSSAAMMGIPLAEGRPKTCSRVLITDTQKTVIAYKLLGKC